ncbi:MAG: response regulator transcription factor [Opitutaceae bacterium]
MTQTPPPRTQPKPLIVVVEDQPELAALVATHLERAEMNVQVCHRGQHGLRFLQKNFANLVLLDINLPDQSGFELAEQLKAADINVPIIFLTGNVEEESKVRGLELGGDDYITKPFSYAELVARIRAVLRRAEVKADLNITKNVKVNDEPFDFCGARVQPQRLEVAFPNGVNATIGRKELGILSYLNGSAGEVVTRKALIHAVWGVHADVKSRSLDQYVAKIRDLYAAQGLSLEQFRTVHGVGYIFDPKGLSQAGR